MERNYGIDLLRLLSMLMVVCLHVLGHGGILDSALPLSRKYEMYWFVEIACYCAVNCYVLISGYVGLNSKYRFSNFVVLWLRVVYYVVIIALLMGFISPAGDNGLFIMNFLPVISEKYWYFTAYAGLFLFIPALNHMVHRTPQRIMRIILVMLIILHSAVPTILGKDIFATRNGYSMLWFLVLYTLGAYIKKNESVNKKWYGLAVYFVCIILTWASKFAIESMISKGISSPFGGNVLVSYCSPTIVIAAVGLLKFFSQIQVGKMKKIIMFMAPLSFSVYLIHDNALISDYFIKNQFSMIISWPLLNQVAVFFITVVGIYLACSIIDVPREVLFKKIGLKKKLLSIEDLFNVQEGDGL